MGSASAKPTARQALWGTANCEPRTVNGEPLTGNGELRTENSEP